MKIFKMTDYRKFLREAIESRPKKGWGVISKLAAFLDVNQVVVSQILGGKRDLTLDQAHQAASFFDLSESETDYFLLMVMLERAATADLKKYALEKMKNLRQDQFQIPKQFPPDQVLTETQKSIFYSSWIYSAVRLYCDVEKGKKPEEVAQHFQISRPRSLAILQFLAEAGLCIESKGLYKMGVKRTSIEFGSPHLVQHHTNWRVRAIEQTEKLTSEEMMITSPVSVSRADFEIIRAELFEMIKSISTRVRDSKSEEVACLNVDWFRVCS